MTARLCSLIPRPGDYSRLLELALRPQGHGGYGASGSVDTVGLDKLLVRLTGQTTETQQTAPPIAAPQDDPLHYLASVLHGQSNDPDSLSGINTNVKVMRILNAARESAKSGRTIVMTH